MKQLTDPSLRSESKNGSPKVMSIEQMVRDLLTLAVTEGLVALPSPSNYERGSPQNRNAGELVAVSNLLSSFLRGERDAALLLKYQKDEDND